MVSVEFSNLVHVNVHVHAPVKGLGLLIQSQSTVCMEDASRRTPGLTTAVACWPFNNRTADFHISAAWTLADEQALIVERNLTRGIHEGQVHCIEWTVVEAILCHVSVTP